MFDEQAGTQAKRKGNVYANNNNANVRKRIANVWIARFAVMYRRVAFIDRLILFHSFEFFVSFCLYARREAASVQSIALQYKSASELDNNNNNTARVFRHREFHVLTHILEDNRFAWRTIASKANSAYMHSPCWWSKQPLLPLWAICGYEKKRNRNDGESIDVARCWCVMKRNTYR